MSSFSIKEIETGLFRNLNSAWSTKTEDPTFIIESDITDNRTVNDLYLFGSHLTLFDIKKFNHDKFEFASDINDLVDKINFDKYDYQLELDYKPLENKKTKNLYR